MPPQPELPHPDHVNVDSMLSRKFGREVTNYFGSKHRASLPSYSHFLILPGSPLNRVSFLRSDHSFLSQALNHGSTRFMLFRDLRPLVHSPSEMAYAIFHDIKSIVPSNVYEKSEDDMIKEYNSTKTVPQLVFLGIDETQKDGLRYKNYMGAPQFAVDVTPKGSFESEASQIVAEMEKRGLRFLDGMRAMSFPPHVGESCGEAMKTPAKHLPFSTRIRNGSSTFGLERQKPFLRNLWPTDIICACRRETNLPTIRFREGSTVWSYRKHHRRRTCISSRASAVLNSNFVVKFDFPTNGPNCDNGCNQS